MQKFQCLLFVLKRSYICLLYNLHNCTFKGCIMAENNLLGKVAFSLDKSYTFQLPSTSRLCSSSSSILTFLESCLFFQLKHDLF